MSIRVNSGSMLLGRTSGFQSMNGVGSWSFIARLRSDINDYGHLFAQTVDNDEINGDYQNADFIGHGPDGTSSYASSYVGGSGAGGGSTSALTVNTWYRFTLVRESTTTLKYYVNGTLVETITQNVSGRSAIGGEWLGRLNGGFPADVAIEGFISWSVALNATEVATQSTYLNPAVQTSNVTTYVPMTDSTLANALVATTGTNLSVVYGTPVTDTNSGFAVFSGGISGDAAINLGNVTSSATANPEINAAASPALGNVTLASDGTVVGGGGAVNADASPTLGNVTSSATGSLSINAEATPSLGNVTSASGGDAGWTVRVAWDDITGEDGYRVKWGTSSGTYTKSADVAANVAQYDIPNLAAGTTYYARVYGLVSGAEQDPSNEISFVVGQPIASAAIGLGNVTASATGNPEVTAAAAPALGSVTLVSAGTVVGTGSTADASIALGNVTSSGTFSLSINADAVPTLGNVTLSADATVTGNGSTADAALTLGAVGLSSDGTVQSSVAGAAALTFGDVWLTSAGTVTQPSGSANADAAIQLGDVTASASGSAASAVVADAGIQVGGLGIEAGAWVTPSPTLEMPVLLQISRGKRPFKRKFVRMYLRKGTRNMNITNTVGATAVVVDASELAVPASVAIHPGAGNTSKVEYSLTPGAAALPDEPTTRWIVWPLGVVSGPSSDVLEGPITALRFTRVTGGNLDTFEVVS